MTARKPVAGERISPKLLRGFEVTRDRMRAEFAPRAHAWLMGRPTKVLTWPQDERALVTEVGVPCVDCLVLVTTVDGKHSVRYAIGVGPHWADGLSAHCGRAPAAERAAAVDAVPAVVRRPRRATTLPVKPAKPAKAPARTRERDG